MQFPCTEKIEELFLARMFDWTLPASQAQWSGESTILKYMYIIKHSTNALKSVYTSGTNITTMIKLIESIWIIFFLLDYPHSLKSWNDLFLVRSDVTCQINVTCQKQKCCRTPTHIFELAPISNDEDIECKHLQGTKPIEWDKPENSTARLPQC